MNVSQRLCQRKKQDIKAEKWLKKIGLYRQGSKRQMNSKRKKERQGIEAKIKAQVLSLKLEL